MPITRLRSPAAAARWLSSWVGGQLTTDSRQVRPGDGFIAWPGAAHDGRRFVEAALAAGATTCLVEEEGVEAFGFGDARIAALRGLKAATGPIAAEFFGRPAEQLDVVATTGTNGKTSTAWWTAQALALLGRPAAVAGTLGLGEPPRPDGRSAAFALEPTGLTTPDPVRLHAALRRFADGGLQALAIEASSIGIVEQRLAALAIDVALFTNFTQDHLDYHGSMDAYWAAKRQLFAWPTLEAAAVNVDDPQGALLARELQAEAAAGRALEVWTVSLQGPARLAAEGLHHAADGLALTLVEQTPAGPARAALATRLVGAFNASNLLVVAAGLRALGLPLAQVAQALAQVTPVPGRLQRVQVDGAGWRAGAAALPEVVVDYAHTPDALDKVLQALRPLAAARGGQLVCAFGCGGNRDATKRPLMGAIAATLADRVVLTSDNPRHEPPALILSQILAGTTGIAGCTQRVAVIEDRREAIAHAVAQAAPQDVLLLAGKGHEDYQEVAGTRLPFSDEAEARAALERRLQQAAPAPAPQPVPPVPPVPPAAGARA